MRLFLVAALFIAGCSKPDPTTPEPDYMIRPEVYRISDSDAKVIDQQLHVKVPREFRSPLKPWRIRAIERNMVANLESMDTAAAQADQTLERVVKFAAFILEKRGYHAQAEQFVSEYHVQYAGFMVAQETAGRDIGDHAPLLSWLATWYTKLESSLGPEVMRTTKLEHIKILNYSIPVVFNPGGTNGEVWDIVDYRQHFAGTREAFFYPLSQHDGFAGVATYWAVWAICTAATQGFGGALPFICAPIGEVSDYGVGRYIAPKLSDRVYCKYSVCQ